MSDKPHCMRGRVIPLNQETDYSLLLKIVPELKERMKDKKYDDVAEEIRRRAVDTPKGFLPFHWMRGMM